MGKSGGKRGLTKPNPLKSTSCSICCFLRSSFLLFDRPLFSIWFVSNGGQFNSFPTHDEDGPSNNIRRKITTRSGHVRLEHRPLVGLGVGLLLEWIPNFNR